MEILLNPLQTGKYTYGQKPPSAFWLEIEQRRNEQQEISEQKMEEAREQIQNWRKEQETNHQRCKERWEKNPQGPNRPTPWHFVPTKPPKPENEQYSTGTSETENEDDPETEQIELEGSEVEEKEETKETEEWYTPRGNKSTETDAERASKDADRLIQEWNDQKKPLRTTTHPPPEHNPPCYNGRR